MLRFSNPIFNHNVAGSFNADLARVVCEETRQTQALVKALHDNVFPLSNILPAWINSLESRVQAAKKIGKSDVSAMAKLTKTQANLDVKAFILEIENNKPADGSSDECSICFEDMLELQTLGCGHTFHEQCVTQWTRASSRTCPLCRAPTDTK